ncbi:glycosyltransferase family 2 protein [Psittacicella gerlachiana]|uniref:Glycosyl transferase n=1 Tax=Psittacicella gerlachiana TaxID=2028574 RepID=A0A3A1YIG4_9GAMM|nr:glycosyltransferase family 2 protein [Psittacicella gerlachiana]RIY36830.1 glycosyl transferase [Psittacicella gerlachiana]
MQEISPVVIIPHYKHADKIGKVIEVLQAKNLPIIVIDDGSDLQSQKQLQTLAQAKGFSLELNSQNQGKGAVVKQAFKLAQAQGYTHAIQVDADGQHQIQDVLKFIALAKVNPQALICGLPIYGADAPKSRLYGRKITNFWNMINTWSLDLADGMCGFRLYPLASINALIEAQPIGDRMDFDTEILVRSHWEAIPMLWLETPVKYNQDGSSHFRAWGDNWLISKMHARLFFGMLGRILRGKKV